MEKILITGASGQIGSELTMALRKKYGNENVFATDLKDAPQDVMESGPFSKLDVLDNQALSAFTKNRCNEPNRKSPYRSFAHRNRVNEENDCSRSGLA